MRKRPYGLLVSWLLCVWHTVGSWNNNRPDPLCGGWVCGCAWFPPHDGDTDMNTFWVLLVGMCVVGLLFENYIVNASIFIRSNFFEIIEPGSDTFGCWFSWFSR